MGGSKPHGKGSRPKARSRCVDSKEQPVRSLLFPREAQCKGRGQKCCPGHGRGSSGRSDGRAGLSPWQSCSWPLWFRAASLCPREQSLQHSLRLGALRTTSSV